MKGQQLADAVAVQLSKKFKGKVWARYVGGGWIEYRGEGLPAHPTLRKEYPNGWSLLDRMRSGEARRLLELN